MFKADSTCSDVDVYEDIQAIITELTVNVKERMNALKHNNRSFYNAAEIAAKNLIAKVGEQEALNQTLGAVAGWEMGQLALQSYSDAVDEWPHGDSFLFRGEKK